MDKVITKGDVVFYARIQPKNATYDVCELKVRTVADTYFVGIDKRDKHAYLFGYNVLNDYVFLDRKQALKVVKEAEKNKVTVDEEVYYEEY